MVNTPFLGLTSPSYTPPGTCADDLSANPKDVKKNDSYADKSVFTQTSQTGAPVTPPPQASVQSQTAALENACKDPAYEGMGLTLNKPADSNQGGIKPDPKDGLAAATQLYSGDSIGGKGSSEDKPTGDKPTGDKPKKTGFFANIGNAIGGIFSSVGNFAASLFGGGNRNQQQA